MLSEEAIEYIKNNHVDKSISSLSREVISKFNIQYKREDSVRRRVSQVLHDTVLKKEEENVKEEIKPLKLNESKYYILTWEQNNSKLHTELWKNILAYKDFLGAELAVILGTYRNNNSMNNVIKWNRETQPYWDFTRHDIHKYVNILSDINVQPTAEYPLNGLEGISRDKTSILGHPKRHFVCLPTLEKAPHKALFTTMSVSLPNYTNSRAGKKAEFAHKNGFIIVEIRDEDVFHIRQVEATKDGSFIDLFYEVSNGEVNTNYFAKAIAWGDIHVGSTDEKLIHTTFRLIRRLNIPTSILHDLADGESVNNHILKDPIQKVRRMDAGKDDVLEELDDIVEFLRALPSDQNVIVNSNHDNRFDRWIRDSDWKGDIKNARAYLILADIALNAENDKGILANILERTPEVSSKITALGLNDSYRIGDIELSHHGHLGTNGSRGSLLQFSKLNVRTITGHSHSPGCFNDAYAVGTSTYLRLGYNNGASNWAQSHCIIHKNDIVQQIIFTRGNFTTFEF